MKCRYFRSMIHCLLAFHLCAINIWSQETDDIYISQATSAKIFDGNRKGFTLGLGVGLGMSLVNAKVATTLEGYDFNTSSYILRLNLPTVFHIGYAPTNQLSINWSSISCNLIVDNLEILVGGVAGIGCTYFLKQDCPSLYFNGVIGYSNFYESLITGKVNSRNNLGIGTAIGFGYEFLKKGCIEFTVCFGTSKKDYLGLMYLEAWMGNPVNLSVTFVKRWD